MPAGGPVRLSVIWYVWLVAGIHLRCRSVAAEGSCGGDVERLCNFTKELDSAGNLRLACGCGDSNDLKTQKIIGFVIAFQGGRHHHRDIAKLDQNGCFKRNAEKVEKIFPDCDCCKDRRQFSVRLLDPVDCDDGTYTCIITFPQKDGNLNCNKTLQWQAPRTTPTTTQLVTTSEETTAVPRAENIRKSDENDHPSTSILIIVIVVAAVVIILVIVIVFITRGCRRLGHHPVNNCSEGDEDRQLVAHLDVNANDDVKEVDEKKVRGYIRARDKARLDHCVDDLDNVLLQENCHCRTTLGDTIRNEDLSHDELSRVEGDNSERTSSSLQYAVTPRSPCCSGGWCEATTHSQDSKVDNDTGDDRLLRPPVPCHHHCCCRHKGFRMADSRPPSRDTTDLSSHDDEEEKCLKGGCREDEPSACDTTDTIRKENNQTAGPSRGDAARGKLSHIPSNGGTTTPLNAQTLLEVDGSHNNNNNNNSQEVQLRDNETQCKRPVSAKGDTLGLPVTCASDDFAQRGGQVEVNDHDPVTAAAVIGRVQRTESGRCDPRLISSKRGVNPQTGRGHKPRLRQLNVTVHPGSDSQEIRGSSTRSQQSDRPPSSFSSVGSRHSTSLKVPLSTT